MSDASDAAQDPAAAHVAVRSRLLQRMVSAMLVVVAVIHLLPLSGVLGAERLEALYGMALDDPNLILLMRHRAVLFGLLGVGLLIAVRRPSLHAAALFAAAVSVVSFLWLAASAESTNAAIGRVVIADVVAAVALGIGAAAHLLARRRAADSASRGPGA